MQSFKNEFDQRGIAVVVASFAEPAKLVPYQEHFHWPFAILSDPQRAAYQAFALKRLSWFRVFSLATLKLYWRLLREGMKREDFGKDDIYQGGGDFLLDRDGNILFAHRSQDPSDRPAVSRLLQVVDQLSR